MSREAAVEAGRVSGRVRFTARAVVLGVVLIVLGLAFVDPVQAYLAERSQVADLQRQAQTLETQNAALESRVKQLQDPAYLEQLARECLGMVKPGDISFVSVPKGSDTGSPHC